MNLALNWQCSLTGSHMPPGYSRIGSRRREKELECVVNSLACQVPVEWRVESGSVPERLASSLGRAADRAPLLVLGKKAPHSGGSAPGTIAYRVLSLADVPS